MAADLTFAYDRGIVADASAGTNRDAMVEWLITAASDSYVRFYFKTPASTPAGTVRVAKGYSSTTNKWEIRYLTSGILALVDSTSGTTQCQTQAALIADTVYRVEARINTTIATCELRVYDTPEATSGPLATTNYSGTSTAITGTWDRVRFGMAAGSTLLTGLSVKLAAPAFSDTGWIGPALFVPEWVTVNKRIIIS